MFRVKVAGFSAKGHMVPQWRENSCGILLGPGSDGSLTFPSAEQQVMLRKESLCTTGELAVCPYKTSIFEQVSSQV